MTLRLLTLTALTALACAASLHAQQYTAESIGLQRQLEMLRRQAEELRYQRQEARRQQEHQREMFNWKIRTEN